MGNTRRRSVALALLIGIAFSVAVMAAPTFSDQDIDNGYVNPKDQVVVQKIKIVNGSSTINSFSIRNTGTADEDVITTIFIDDDDNPFAGPLGQYTSLVGLRSGLHLPFDYEVPSGTSYLWIGVEIAAAAQVTGGETIQFRVRFYSGDYTTSYITDGSEEEIFKGGFEEKDDDSPSACYLNPGDADVSVQEATFTDNDGNNEDVGITKVAVANLKTADHNDVVNVQVKVTGKVGGVENTYTDDKPPTLADWGSGNALEFTAADLGLPAAFDDDEAVTVEVKVTVGGTTDKHKIRTSVTLTTQENGETYDQSLHASTTHTIRVQGFEAISEVSDKVPSGVKSPGEELVQKVTVTDDDVNNHDVIANGIWIKNEGTVTKDDIEKIVVKRTNPDTTLRTINSAAIQNFATGHLYNFTTNRTVPDDESATFTVSYTIAANNPAGRTLQPTIYIQGEENGIDYPKLPEQGDKVTYPDLIALYSHGLETVSNVITPPSGGTAYSGQRLLAQKILCIDQDENSDSVHINPISFKNTATNHCGEDEVSKIEVRTSGGALLGQETNMAGLNTGGIAISTLQNNVVADNSEVTLYVYVTFSGPENVTAGHKFKLESTIFWEEDGHTGNNTVKSAEWTLAINHRPTCNFDYDPEENLTYETEITFNVTDASDVDGDDIVGYQWDFSDGGTGTGTSTKHTFAAGGSVWAKLTVEDERGVTGSKKKTFDVEPPPVVPVAAFTWTPTSPGSGEEIQFEDTSTTEGDTTITKREWDFGDGTTSKKENPKHTYDDPGTYAVSLKVTNSDDQTDTVTRDIEVSAFKPIADFNYSPATPDVGDTITFTDKSTVTAPATITKRAWSFGDGTTSTLKNPTHKYTAIGTYTVSLTVTDSLEQASNAHTEEIFVGPPMLLYFYPNPASDTATIAYRFPAGSTNLELVVMNITGSLIYRKELSTGTTEYNWGLVSSSGSDLPNGLYFCVITAKDASGNTIKSPIFKLLIERLREGELP